MLGRRTHLDANGRGEDRSITGACGAVLALLRPEVVAPLAGDRAPHVVSACDAVGRWKRRGSLWLPTSRPDEHAGGEFESWITRTEALLLRALQRRT